jgi:3-keto-5-aminohexanoate cleavage enzyme
MNTMPPKKPFILEVRANEYTMRGGNVNVPWTPDEIVADAVACAEAGAAIYHFHARMPDGKPDHRLQTYQYIIRRIKEQSNILVHPTLGAIALAGTAQERLANVEALCADTATKPHFAPLDMGSTNADIRDPESGRFITEDKVYTNTTKTLKHFATRMPQLGLKPYVMSWSVIYTRQIEAFMAMGLIDEPVYLAFNLAEGHSVAGHPGTIRGLTSLLDFLPPGRVEWTTCVHGGSMIPLLGAICQLGGHASIGLGDHPYSELGGQPVNAEVIRWAGGFVRMCGRVPATPAQAKELLNIS